MRIKEKREINLSMMNSHIKRCVQASQKSRI